MVLEPAAEVVTERSYHVGECGVDPVVQLLVAGCIFLDLVEHLRLEVGENEPLQVLEQSNLDESCPVEVGCGFLILAQYVGDDHLVSLLVEFCELDRANLVIPALHIRSVEQSYDKPACNHEYTNCSYCLRHYTPAVVTYIPFCIVHECCRGMAGFAYVPSWYNQALSPGSTTAKEA